MQSPTEVVCSDVSRFHRHGNGSIRTSWTSSGSSFCERRRMRPQIIVFTVSMEFEHLIANPALMGEELFCRRIFVVSLPTLFFFSGLLKTGTKRSNNSRSTVVVWVPASPNAANKGHVIHHQVDKVVVLVRARWKTLGLHCCC